ncbi:MAG TPA: hypothetical protein VLM85_22985 [Polyangiaceae bacterium]|nr:hypothetical protein [Polyangiaceae bacterium]
MLGATGAVAIASTLAVAFELARAITERPVAYAVAVGAGLVAARVVLRPLTRLHATTRVEGALDRFESLGLAAGRTLLVCGLLGLLGRSGFAHALSGLACAFALALLGVVAVRDRARGRALRRIYAKEDPSFRVERDADVRGYELLPPVLSGTLTDAVIAHVHGAATYRHSGGPRPVARCHASLSKMLARMGRRARGSLTVAAGASVCVVMLPFVSGYGAKHAAASASAPHASLVAPACVEARPYFAEQLEGNGFGRATLLTHAQDPSLAVGEGVLLLVPRGEPRALTPSEKARALAIARDIPCRDKLSLSVEDPRRRPFAVEATLRLEPGADEARVLTDATDQVRELFQPDSRTILNEHLGFGEAEKTFGYRVRWVLRRVAGVRSVELTVNGSDHDVALEPRDFPALESLAIHVSR